MKPTKPSLVIREINRNQILFDFNNQGNLWTIYGLKIIKYMKIISFSEVK